MTSTEFFLSESSFYNPKTYRAIIEVNLQKTSKNSFKEFELLIKKPKQQQQKNSTKKALQNENMQLWTNFHVHTMIIYLYIYIYISVRSQEEWSAYYPIASSHSNIHYLKSQSWFNHIIPNTLLQ